MQATAHKLMASVPTPIQHWAHDIWGFLVQPATLIRSYRRADLWPDLLAGLTVAVVLLPQAIAYALIAELPPQIGLYAAIVAAIVGALWGSSAHLHTGPTNAASLLVLATLLPIAQPDTPEYLAAAGLMAVMVGILRLFLGFARLGLLVNFVSDSVIVGFTAGAGVLIGANQLRHLLRLDIPSSDDFYVTVTQIVQHINATHWVSLLLGLGTIAAILILKRVNPRLPGPLIALGVSAAIVALLGLDQQGVKVVGETPRSLPPPTALPLFDLDLIGQLSTGALAISLIGLVEALSIARSIAAQSGQYLDSNQEFVGQGFANVAAGFFSGYTCSGSFTRSAVNYSAGARTAFSSIFSGLFVMAAMLLFAPLTAYLPRTALAGVLIVTAYSMIDQREMVRIWHTSRGDTFIMVATLLAAILLPLQFAVLAGVLVSFGRFIIKTSTPEVETVVPDENFRHFIRQDELPPCPQLGIINVSGPLYFGAAHHVEAGIRANLEQHPEQHLLLLRLHLVDHCDVTGIHALEAVVRLYRKNGGDVFIAGVRPAVKERMQMSSFAAMLGEDHFLTRENAISHLFHKVIDPSVCIYECPVRVFAECQALPKQPYSQALIEVAARPLRPVQTWLPDELKASLERHDGAPDVLLIDVREPREYQQRHIPHAQLMPLSTIAQQGQSLPTDRPIVLICRVGRRSRLAASILQDMGYTEVAQLQGGMLAWEAAGYPIAVG